MSEKPTEQELARIREFEITMTHCSITGAIDKCVSIPLATGRVPVTNERGQTIVDPVTGDTKYAEFDVIGHFSERGLQIIQHKLQEASHPVFALKSPDEVRAENPYGWLAIYHTGQRIYQYPETGGETSFATIHIPDLQSFWIIPRNEHQLPAYGLIKDMGFVRAATNGGDLESLDIPWPGPGIDFWVQYYRRVYRRGTVGGGVTQEEPAYIKQILGWRIEQNGKSVILEISVEEDGSWQPHTKEPLDHPLLAARECETAVA